MKTIDDILEEMNDEEARGRRWIVTRKMEPLKDSIKRRVHLLWGCVTFNPDPDFHDEFRPFRQERNDWRKVWPGEPGYETAERDADQVYKKVLSNNPWLDLLKGVTFPPNLGKTVTKS